MTTTTTPKTLAAEAAALRAKAAEADRKAAEIRTRAEEAAQRAEARRQAEIAAIRRRRLAHYDDAALAAEERAAAQRFRQAVEDGKPGILEFTEWRAANGRHYMLAAEARSIQSALEPDAPAIATPGPGLGSYADAVQQAIENMVADRNEDLEDQRPSRAGRGRAVMGQDAIAPAVNGRLPGVDDITPRDADGNEVFPPS